MNGYTRWEMALLKSKYHSSDENHKGYLDRTDVAHLATRAGVCTPDFVDDLFFKMDRNHDGQVTFEELTQFLTVFHTLEARKLKKHFLATDATVAAGATMGLLALVKSKVLFGLGAYFADPIRIFREDYVKTTAGVRSAWTRNAGATATGLPAEQPGLRTVFARVGILKGVGWTVFSICLDSGVGVCMFLTYAYARAALANALRKLDKPPANYEEMMAASDPPFVSQLALELGGGAAAGFVSAVLEAPAQALATSQLCRCALIPAFKTATIRWHSRIARGTLSHAAFFGSFYACRTLGDTLLFEKLGARRTTFSSAMLTATAGCGAGAGYRLIAVPMENRNLLIRGKGRAAWNALSLRCKGRELTRGLGQSLIFTMPVTGIVFLGYEYMLLSV
jgi:hypothetical protein